MADIHLWGTWDLSALTPRFVGLSHIVHVLLRARATPHTLVAWQSRAGQHHMLLSDFTAGEHPPGKVQSFISAVIHWSAFITFPERPYHPQGSPVQPLPRATQIKSWLLFISSLCPNHQTTADWGYAANSKYREVQNLFPAVICLIKSPLHLKKTPPALVFVPKSSNSHSYCRHSISGVGKIKKKN